MRDGFLDLVAKYVHIQESIVCEFTRLYPAVNDSKWMLGVPAKGLINVGGESWRFIKHGAGVRFFLEGGTERLIIDVHRLFGVSNFIDWWRLAQFFESCGVNMDKDEIILGLQGMNSSGSVSEYDGGYIYNIA
ncbi:hypothetical protein [Pseudomonas sp.]|uniref:DUF6896 domain-containing protein n=1 Tax=Pseudomonas sp. TaxID=306 RepID=UPI0031CF0469